jgi:hypothetical protein
MHFKLHMYARQAQQRAGTCAHDIICLMHSVMLMAMLSEEAAWQII